MGVLIPSGVLCCALKLGPAACYSISGHPSLAMGCLGDDKLGLSAFSGLL
jgi:hypothetical protein